MEAVRSIDELYEAVKGYDMVLCNDAPLATALNNRVDKAILGHFAVTPRQLAASKAVELTGKPLIDDIRLVKRVSVDTGYSLRYVHGEIGNIKTALRYAKEPRNLGRKAKRVWNAFLYYNTLERLMMSIEDKHLPEFYGSKRVAVVGSELFDELDKHMIPNSPGTDFFEITKEDSDFSIEEIRVLGNDRQIAECAADLARRCGPSDVAIVMDTGGAMADAVKSALYRAELPFINSLNISDLSSVRDFLEFIQLALSFETVKVRDVRELMSAYGGGIAGRYDMYYLSKFAGTKIRKSNRTEEILRVMSTVRDRTFGEVCKSCVPSAERPSVTMLLDQMECDKENVSQDLLDDLVYAVNNISDLDHNEQQSKDEKTGVLLVDCKNSVYVDRPVVVYTGMCGEWETDLTVLDYIDPNKRLDIEDVYTLRFKALIQQGSVRFYLANATKGGREAVPCKYFDACMRKKHYAWEWDELSEEEKASDKPITKFEQIAERIVTGTWKIEWRDRSAAGGTDLMEDQGPPEAFSTSSYIKFLECPRQYMLSRLARTPDRSATYTGDRIHDYAEFRISYPDIAKENGPDYYAEMIASECAPLNSPDLENVERSKIFTAVRMIDRFIESVGTLPGRMVPRAPDKEEKNVFLLHHGLELTSENSEVQLTSRDSPLHGIIDMLWEGVIYDFKSGKDNAPSDLIKKYDLTKLKEGGSRLTEHKDSQAMFYIALLESCGMPSRNEFDLFYPQQAYRGQLEGREPDVQSCIRRVVLEESWEDALRRHGGNVLSAGKYTKYNLDPANLYVNCASILGPDPRKWDPESRSLEAAAVSLNVLGKKRDYNKTCTGTMIDAANAVRKFFLKDIQRSSQPNTLFIVRPVLEKFKEDLRRDMDRLHSYYRGEFPTDARIKCSICDCRDMCVCECTVGDEDAGSE